MSDTENQWRDKKVRPRLDALIKQGYPLYYFVKEAGSLRGIPDLVICSNGLFFAWELKRSASEASKTSGRIVLQRYTCSRIEQAHGRARIVHPENLEECLQELLETLPQQPSSSKARLLALRETEAIS